MNATLAKIRFESARWLFLIGLVLLVFCAVLIVGIWIKAAASELLPSEMSANERAGNHGPWRYTILRSYVTYAIMLPLFAGMSSLLSLLVKPSQRAGVLLAICVVVFFVIAIAHFWLID